MSRRNSLRAACLPLLVVLGTLWLSAASSSAAGAEGYVFVSDFSRSLGLVENAQFQRPALPNAEASSPVQLPSAARSANLELFSTFGVNRSSLAATSAKNYVTLTSANSVLGAESVIRATTDTGDLLGSSPSILNTGVQRRNPVVTDPRIRGSRIGSLAASGSHWVPARIDLDTVLSKIDSRIVDQTTVIPGPYSALHGPGFEFIDVQLLRAPRYARGFESHGQSLVNFKTNGDHWRGRQRAWGGSKDWGYRFGYGHSTGNDYVSGSNTSIPSSFKSRDIYAAFGGELNEYDSIDVSYLRLDQTDVELAGQAFDIDYLVTDGYEVSYVVRDHYLFDELLLESWYNATRFEGSAQRSSKRAQFPFYDFLGFTGFTDVDSMSTGYRAAFSWDGTNDERLTAGADLRYVKQELNEITSGRLGFLVWDNANSPIPRSHFSNPGLFVELVKPIDEQTSVTTGARVDWVSTNVEESAAELARVGTIQVSAEDILGSGAFSQDELLGSAFLSVHRKLNKEWSAGGSVGYAERAPNLTERYAVQPFMFLLQNGLNTVTGDPKLDKERLIQFDLRLTCNTERMRSSLVAYHAWAFDYITYENLRVVPGPPVGDIEQVNLKYVNTERARLWGFEGFLEYDATSWLVPFATIKYVHAEDRTRNGNFATSEATQTAASEQVFGLSRGSSSLVPGAAVEPLPGILPLESRVGVRINEPGSNPEWGIELYARIVDNQNRIAASLLESPTPGFATYDLRAFWRPYDDLQLVAGVENFTDKNYREHLDFRAQNGIAVLQQGVSFYFGSELSY